MVVVPLLTSVKGMALVDSAIEFPLTSQTFTVMAAGEDREPDASVILMVLRKLISLDAYMVVPLVYTAGMLILLSELLLMFVMIYLDELTVNSYAIGVPPVNLAARAVPVMIVVPRLYSLRAAVADSGIAFPLISQAATVMAAPEEEREPDTSLILMVLRGPMELATKVVVPLV